MTRSFTKYGLVTDKDHMYMTDMLIEVFVSLMYVCKYHSKLRYVTLACNKWGMKSSRNRQTFRAVEHDLNIDVNF